MNGLDKLSNVLALLAIIIGYISSYQALHSVSEVLEISGYFVMLGGENNLKILRGTIKF